MYFFLCLYLSVYGGMIAYSLFKVYLAFAFGWRGAVMLAAGGVLLLAAPILQQRLSGAHAYSLVRAFAFAAWISMALVFWFTLLNGATDLWNLGTHAVSWLTPAAARWHISPRPAILVHAVMLLVACAWGYVEAGCVRLKTVEIPTRRLPANAPPLRLIQIADLHLGRTSRDVVFAKVLRLVRAARPDVLVSTGDLLDATDPPMAALMRQFTEIQPPLGKFAVLGNHEVYPGVMAATCLLQAAGFVVLKEETAPVGEHLLLAGVNEPAVLRGTGGKPQTDEAALLRAARDARFLLLLKHQPRVTATARAYADLQLSGHTHQGQIFPFAWFVHLFYSYPHGRLIAFPEGLHLYVSPGAGTWGPPFRLLAPPEVTLFLLKPVAGTL